MVEISAKGKLGQFDSSGSQVEPLPTEKIKELVADIKNLRLSFFQSFDLQVNRVGTSFDTKIGKGGGISNADFLQPTIAFSESNSKKHGGKYVDQRGSGNLALGEAVAVAYNDPGREPVFMMRGKMGTDGVGRPNPTTFVIKFNNHESVQKLEQLISAGGGNPDYITQLFKQVCEEATKGQFEKLVRSQWVNEAPFFRPINLLGFEDFRQRKKKVAPKSSIRPEVPRTISIEIEKTGKEKLSVSEELVLLPSDHSVSQKIVGGDLKETIYMDFPETQETPGNITVLSSSGEFSLIRAVNNGKKTFRIVKGNFSKSESFQPINKQVDDRIDIDDSEFFTKIDSQTTLAVFSDFQGATYMEGEQVRPEAKGVYTALNNSVLNALDGADPYSIPYVHSGHMNIIHDSLTDQQFNTIEARNKYAVGMTVGFNEFGQIVIQGAGYLSRDDGGRSYNPSAFVLVLNRNLETERLASFLLSADVDAKDKRWILGEVFETVNENYPNKSRTNHFFDQENVDLMVVDRTKLPRALLDASQIIESGSDLKESPTFKITNLSEAVYVANDLIKQGLLGKVNVVFNGRNGSIDFSKLDSQLVQQLVDGFSKGNVEEYRRDSRHCTTTDRFAEKPYSIEPIVPTVLKIKKIDNNVLFLLTSLRLPETRNVGRDSHYFFDNESFIYIPTKGSRFEVDFETNPQGIDNLQIRNIGFDVAVTIPNRFHWSDKTTLIFKSSGNKADGKKWSEHFSSIAASDFKGTIMIDQSAAQSSLGDARLNLAKEVEPGFRVYIPDRNIAQKFKNHNKKILVMGPQKSGGGYESIQASAFSF